MSTVEQVRQNVAAAAIPPTLMLIAEIRDLLAPVAHRSWPSGLPENQDLPLKLDSHQHFWKYSDAEYGWIDDPALRHDFLPGNLHKEFRAAKIDGSVSVQARQTVAKPNGCFRSPIKINFMKGVVGWVPLTSPSVEADIEKFASRKN